MGREAPIQVLFVVVIAMVAQILIEDGTQLTDPDTPITDPNNSTTFGFSEDPGVFGVLGAIWDTVTTFADLLSFGYITDAPWYFRIPAGFLLTGSLAWSIAGLIRG